MGSAQAAMTLNKQLETAGNAAGRLVPAKSVNGYQVWADTKVGLQMN
jgi:hypothetical protein